jgi:hypothetical protein
MHPTPFECCSNLILLHHVGSVSNVGDPKMKPKPEVMSRRTLTVSKGNIEALPRNASVESRKRFKMVIYQV